MIYVNPKSLTPIISIDVSKGKANAIEALYPIDLDGKKKPTVHVFSYDKAGLEELSTMYDEVMRIRNDGVVPVILMEHTGIYTAPIIRYCKKHDNSLLETIYLCSQKGLIKAIKDGEKEDPNKMKEYKRGEEW